MEEATDGVDNLEADGTFLCSHGWLNAGKAVWVTDRWKRGTSPRGSEMRFECPKGHVTKAPRESPPDRCSNLLCRSTELTERGGRIWGENCGMWPYDETTIVPRTCSFCGGIHPDDLIELLRAGFRMECTDKGYKYYVNAPDGKGLTPPIKFYTNHGHGDYVQRINDAIRERLIGTTTA